LFTKASSSPNRIDGRTIVAPGKRATHLLLAQGLGRGIAAVGLHVGADRRDVDERGSARGCCGRCRRTGTVGLQRALVAAERADQINRRVGAVQRRRHAALVGDVAAAEVDLPEVGERLEAEGLLGMAIDDPQAGAALQQLLREVRARKPPPPISTTSLSSSGAR
jgi:hypothetical protein